VKTLYTNSTGKQLSKEELFYAKDLIDIYEKLKNIFLVYTFKVTTNKTPDNINKHENLEKNN
jgi:hypothetical protein